MERESPPTLTDPFGRRINYLRLAVTDRCDLRCRYCAPAGGAPGPAVEILGDEEVLAIARAALALGMEKIRVTGGEPLLRPGLVPLLRKLGSLPGLSRLVLTTNGISLAAFAGDLRRAGVESLNISLDSLRPATFRRITRGGDLGRVLEGIAAAERARFPRIKINVVVLRGINDGEAADFADLTVEKPWSVRFIEFMPTAGGEDWASLAVPAGEVLARLRRRHDLRPIEGEDLGGPARRFRIPGAAGSIGLITPLSCGFCGSCNRIRVTAAGLAVGCLFSEGGIDLRPILRDGSGPALEAALRKVVGEKPRMHRLGFDSPDRGEVQMSRVGG